MHIVYIMYRGALFVLIKKGGGTFQACVMDLQCVCVCVCVCCVPPGANVSVIVRLVSLHLIMPSLSHGLDCIDICVCVCVCVCVQSSMAL